VGSVYAKSWVLGMKVAEERDAERDKNSCPLSKGQVKGERMGGAQKEIRLQS